jgi:hypothetical protein
VNSSRYSGNRWYRTRQRRQLPTSAGAKIAYRATNCLLRMIIFADEKCDDGQDRDNGTFRDGIQPGMNGVIARDHGIAFTV